MLLCAAWDYTYLNNLKPTYFNRQKQLGEPGKIELNTVNKFTAKI